MNIGIDKDERFVEIPWSLGRCKGGQRLLDVGCCHVTDYYINSLKRLNYDMFHGIDISKKESFAYIRKREDIRKTSYVNNYFDTILCISTIEHIGKDNTKFYEPSCELKNTDNRQDIIALKEMYRILKSKGNIIITVPYGKYKDYGWFINYDNEYLQELINSTDYKEVTIEYFKYDDGWVKCYKEDLNDVLYGNNKSIGAGGIACVEIVKEQCNENIKKLRI